MNLTNLSYQWKRIKLGDLAVFRNGINYNKENFGKGLKVINVKDFQDYSYANYYELDEINPNGILKEEDLLKNNDIIFVRSNGNRELIGRSLFVKNCNENVTHSAFTIKVRFTSNSAYPLFYAYLFRTSLIRQTLSSQGNGTNISNLNQGILTNLEVPLPPFSTQQKIVSILSAYDDLIENNTRRIEILEEMARMLYREWFVKFRFPGHENVRFVESELGLIPQGWEVLKMEELVEYSIGGGWGEEEKSEQFPIQAYVIRGTDIPLARIHNIEKCPLRFHKQSNFITRKIQPEDLILEVSGGSKGQPVGRAILINKNLLHQFQYPVICASFCKLIRIKRNIINPVFVYLHLLEMYDNGKMEKYSVQSTGITNFKYAFFLENEQVIVPELVSQIKLEQILSPLLEKIQILAIKNTNLRKTRDLLLPKLISGEIDVENLDINTGEDTF